MSESFLIQAGFQFHWNKAEGALDTALDWISMTGGIKDISPESNEQISQEFYYPNGGNATTDVIGMQDVWSFDGHREYNNEFQKYVFEELKYLLGAARRGTFRVTYPNGAKEIANSTIANIKAPGGPANEKGAISFEIHMNEIPKFTAAPVIP